MALPVDVAAALLRDRNGCPKAVIAIIRDVTERKRAEAALRESRDELQAIYDAMIDGVVIVDLETKGCLRANARMAALLGYSLEELPRDANAVHRPEDMPLLAAKFQAQVEGRLPLAENVPFLRKDGSVIYTDVSSQPMEYQGRKCRICFVRDVTEWKRAEEELRESRERFRAGFEEAPIGIVLADKERKLMRVNRAFCHMLGYTAEELIGRRVPEFLYPEDHERVMPLVQAVFRGEQASFTIEKRYLRKDGASFWVQATTSAVHGPDGEVAFVMGIVEDIDARKRAQEAWQREHQTLWHMLRSSDHERQLIAYEIHDGLAQQLAAALMQFQTHDHLHTLQPSQAQPGLLRRGCRWCGRPISRARRLISGVRPPILDESGIVAALGPSGPRAADARRPQDRVPQRGQLRPAGAGVGECHLSRRPGGHGQRLPAQPQPPGARPTPGDRRDTSRWRSATGAWASIRGRSAPTALAWRGFASAPDCSAAR